MIQLNLDEEQTLLVEYACSLFLESLKGSKGALEALQKQGITKIDNIFLATFNSSDQSLSAYLTNKNI